MVIQNLNKCSHVLIALGLASIVTTPTHGQSIEQPVGAEEIERVVTTATRDAVVEAQLPFVIDDIAETQINLISPNHVQELLRQVAGANIQRGNGQEYLPALRSPVLTGAGACGGLLIAEDNIPLRAAGFCNINELFEAHTEMAQRIEVLKGPVSPLYGSNAIHGVINVITPDTTSDNASVGLDWGSFGYSRARLRAGTSLDSGGIGVNASIARDGGYRDGEGFDQQKINIRHRFDATQYSLTTGFTYTHLDQDTAGFVVGENSFEDETLSRQNVNLGAYRKAESFRLWSRLDTKLDDIDISVTPYIRNQDMAFLMHFLPGTPIEENDQKGVGVLSSFRFALNNNYTVQWGLDAEYTQGALRQFQNEPTQGSNFLVETVPVGLHYDYEVDATQIAPYINIVGTWDKLSATIGGRWEHMGYDYTNNMLTGRTREDGSECGFGGCRYSRPASDDVSFSAFSPKLGLTYALSSDTRVFANIAKGYRAPQATELFRLQRAQVLADLDSVDAQQFEIGLKTFRNNWSLVTSVYQLDKDNVIYRDSDFFNLSNGETRHQGIELSFNADLTSQWSLQLNGSYSRQTYRHQQRLNDIQIQGNDIDTAPRWLVNGVLGFQPVDSVQAQLEWQHVGDYFTDPENLHQYAGHNVFALYGQWMVNDWFELGVRVQNLFDKRYAERADFSGFSGDRYFPGRPRNAQVTMNIKWF